MASDDPLEKSLFTRIKDCVLTELRRSNRDIKRSSCASRTSWAWEIEDKNATTKKSDSAERGEGQQPKGATAKMAEDEQQCDKDEQKSGEMHKHQEGKEDGASNQLHMEKHQESHGSKLGDAQPKSSSEKDKSQDQGDSCRPKPVRYYIKMQNPEAPVCCESLIKPRKICPPKARRRAQQETRDSWPRRTCRCGGCCSSN